MNTVIRLFLLQCNMSFDCGTRSGDSEPPLSPLSIQNNELAVGGGLGSRNFPCLDGNFPWGWGKWILGFVGNVLRRRMNYLKIDISSVR